MDWSSVVDDLLRSVGWPGEGRQPNTFELYDTRAALVSSLARTVPESDHLHSQGDGAGRSTLLVLSDSTLFRITFRLDDNESTLETEMLDLRRVTGVRLRERRFSDSGRPVLATAWHFDLEGADPLTVEWEGLEPEDSDPGRPWRFGRLVAHAAGWPQVG